MCIAPERGPFDSDADILALFAAGQQNAALALLMQRHGPSVRRFCRRGLRDDARAEDVEQLVYIQACRDLPRFAARSTLRSWLLAIARHRVLDEVKAEARWRRRSHATIELTEPSVHGPDAQLERRRQCEALGIALGGLPRRTRAALALRYGESRSYEDMAELLDEKPCTLQARVTRAVVRLRQRLGRGAECQP